MTTKSIETIQREINNTKWALERHQQTRRFRWPWRSIEGAYWDWRSECALEDSEDIREGDEDA